MGRARRGRKPVGAVVAVSLTAIVTNHDYAEFLPACLDGATKFCDEVLVYDDGSTDDSLEVISRYGVKVVHRDDASGDPVWGSNEGIKDASCSHLMFLDADNFLLSKPPTNDVDYTFAPIHIFEDGAFVDYWDYAGWPLDAAVCLRRFRSTKQIPVPWGGVWRTEFVRPLAWSRWPSTSFAADFRTCVDWLGHSPTLAYHDTSFLAFRVHDGQWSGSSERILMQNDVEAYLTRGER